MAADQPRFLTLADVADVLNVTIRQVYALVRNGDLRGIQIGGRGQWASRPSSSRTTSSDSTRGPMRTSSRAEGQRGQRHERHRAGSPRASRDRHEITSHDVDCAVDGGSIRSREKRAVAVVPAARSR